jgi:hypothetical protein
MRGLVRGSAGLDQPVKDDRDDDDTAANANQTGEQSGSSARNHAQKDQPKGAHCARICQMELNPGPIDRAMLARQPRGLAGQADRKEPGIYA